MHLSIFQPFADSWRRLSGICWVALLMWVFCSVLHAAEPVSFEFKVTPDGRNPFARELWADVVTPSGSVLHLPAFYAGKDRFAVRARAEAKGRYQLGKVSETVADRTVVLPATAVGRTTINNRETIAPPAIKIAADDPCAFQFTSGERFAPVGTNLAWADKRLRFYRKAFKAFPKAGLNWMRVWMVHWSGLNLDWLPADMGKSPSPGTLDLRVAANWDKMVALAEENGVYLQIVLQHHGQYSSQVNPSWRDNPWNAANPGGFLKSAAEFFTSPEALSLTRMKYRYIVARWGYSPAVMAWELFNEVHWVDAMRGETRDEAAVARWHSTMAAYIRSFDAYRHLITTSTENLQSAIYADMDYFQPHLYASNLLAGVRHLDAEPTALARPIFYGEVGDDHLPVSADEKKSGITIVPPLWASLMGEGRYLAQPWLGHDLMATGRMEELSAVSRFVAATRLGRRVDVAPFSPPVESTTRVPFVLAGAYQWKQSSSHEVVVPLDGREPLEFALIPQIFMCAPDGKEGEYPNRVTYHFKCPKPVTLRLQITETSTAAGAMRVSIDGVVAAEQPWFERPKNEPVQTARSLTVPEVQVVVPAGAHAVVVENSAATGWFDLPKIDLELDVSVLAAAGQRSAGFMAIWVWHRTGVFSSKPTAPAAGTVVLDEVAEGSWRVTWWDTLKGTAAAPTLIQHQGGPLRLPTPLISRHAAVVLERQ